MAFQVYVALVKARLVFPSDGGRSTGPSGAAAGAAHQQADPSSSVAGSPSTDAGDVTAAVVDGKKVPVMFLSQRQRRKLGLKNVFDDAEALKERRLAQVRLWVPLPVCCFRLCKAVSQRKCLYLGFGTQRTETRTKRWSRFTSSAVARRGGKGDGHTVRCNSCALTPACPVVGAVLAVLTSPLPGFNRRAAERSTKTDEGAQSPDGEDDVGSVAENNAGADDDDSAFLQALIDRATWPFTVTICTFLMAYVPIIRMASVRSQFLFCTTLRVVWVWEQINRDWKCSCLPACL